MCDAFPYDFAKGHPNAEELPAAELQAVLGRLSLSRNNDGADNDTDNLAVLREALQYGRDEGSRDFLRQLSCFLERQCRPDVGPWCGEEENGTTTASAATSFFVTEGVSHAVDLLAAVATQPGDLVLTERPTYYLVAGIFRSHGLRIGALPMKAEVAATATDRRRLKLRRMGTMPRRMMTMMRMTMMHSWAWTWIAWNRISPRASVVRASCT